MDEGLFKGVVNWLLGPEPITEKRPGHLWPRWIFLRALGLIYFSAFYSLLFQIKGLIGPNGILPAADYLQAVSAALHLQSYWTVPTLLWFGAGNGALMMLCWVGLVASLLVTLNLWPRAGLLICFLCFVSFVSAARDFSGYQSDGMLLEAGFIALFFAPPGLRPRLGELNPPSRASLFLLQWEWFRIYFESGVAKIGSGDQAWRNFTAMDDYYQNGPLPTWIGWYVQHLPHWFHAAATGYTLVVELLIVWMLFLPRRFRIACFLIVTPFEISIIATANYTFLNYLVLLLGVLLLDDRFLEWVLPLRFRELDSWKERDGCGWCCGGSAETYQRPSGMARKTYAAAQVICGGVPGTGVLFHDGTAAVDVHAWVAAAGSTGAGAGAVSHRQFLWIVCGDDARAL